MSRVQSRARLTYCNQEPHSANSIYYSFFRFTTLRAGLNHLRHEESRRATGPLAFVKENVGTFLDAVDTLISILVYYIIKLPHNVHSD